MHLISEYLEAESPPEANAADLARDRQAHLYESDHSVWLRP
jgi:hypothetical protein